MRWEIEVQQLEAELCGFTTANLDRQNITLSSFSLFSSNKVTYSQDLMHCKPSRLRRLSVLLLIIKSLCLLAKYNICFYSLCFKTKISMKQR